MWSGDLSETLSNDVCILCRRQRGNTCHINRAVSEAFAKSFHVLMFLDGRVSKRLERIMSLLRSAIKIAILDRWPFCHSENAAMVLPMLVETALARRRSSLIKPDKSMMRSVAFKDIEKCHEALPASRCQI